MSTNWNTIQGDLDKLIADESYDEFVILERSDASLEQLKKSENDSPKVMQIVLGRVERSKVDFSDPEYLRIPAGRKSFSAFLFLGIDKRRQENRAYFDYYTKIYEDLKSIDEFEKDNVFDFESNEILFQNAIDSSQRNIQNLNKALFSVREKLLDKGRLETKSYLDFATGERPAYFVEMLFDTLQKLNVLDQAEVQFLKSISIYRKPSIEEGILNEKLEKAFNCCQYEEAVEIAKSLHSLSRKEAFERGATNVRTCDEVTKLRLLDDCETAYKLGEALVLISPKYAVAAFQIITAYETHEMSFDAYYKSPFLEQALEKLVGAQITYLSSISDERIARKLRKETIISAFLAGGDSNDTEKLALSLIETQAGFNNMGSENRLFDKLDLRLEDEMGSGIGYFLDIIFAMADKLSEFNKSTKTLSSATKPLTFIQKPKPTLSLDEDDSVEYEIEDKPENKRVSVRPSKDLAGQS